MQDLSRTTLASPMPPEPRTYRQLEHAATGSSTAGPDRLPALACYGLIRWRSFDDSLSLSVVRFDICCTPMGFAHNDDYVKS